MSRDEREHCRKTQRLPQDFHCYRTRLKVTQSIQVRDRPDSVPTPNFDQPVTIANPKPTGLTNIAKIETPVNATRVTSLNAATGAFAGSFVIPGASTALNRPAAFQGQIVCIGGTTQGYGFFLLPQVPTGSEKVSTAPKLSGVVKLLSP